MTDIVTTSLAAGGAFDPASITQLFLALGVLLGLAKLLGELCAWAKQPAVLGEILAGVLLGPTILGSIHEPTATFLFPTEGVVNYALEAIFIIAAVMLLLIAGLEVELSTAVRQGKSAVYVSVMSMVVPFAVGVPVAYFWPEGLGMDEIPANMKLAFVLFIGIALSITALPVIARILMDMNLAKSDLGVVVISSAMVNDLLGWMGFAMVLALIEVDAGGGGEGGAAKVAYTMLYTLLFVGLMLTAGKWLFHRLIPFVQVHASWPGGVLGLVIVAALFGAAVTEWIGIHSIFGAFIAGVAIGDSRHLRQSTRRVVHEFVSNFFSPLFFASIGLGVNFVADFNILAVVVVLVIAIIGKLLGSYLGARWAGMSKRESGAIGFGMCARGAMEIILGKLALEAGLINEELFVALVIMALATSLMAGPAIERVLQRSQPRRLRDVLKEKYFVHGLTAKTSHEAIRELAGRTDQAELIAETAIRRERVLSTGVGEEVAVPHARIEGLKASIIVIGVSEEGVDFDAPDGKAARVVALLVTPTDDPDAQIELLGLVAHTFSDRAIRDQALAAENFTEFLAATETIDTGH